MQSKVLKNIKQIYLIIKKILKNLVNNVQIMMLVIILIKKMIAKKMLAKKIVKIVILY